MRISELVQKASVPAEAKIKQKDYQDSGLFPVIDQGAKLIGGYSDDSQRIINCQLPVIVFGDHTRAVKYIDFPFCAGADGIKVLQPTANIVPKYLYYGLQYLRETIKDRGYARHYQFIEKLDLSVPSVQEQVEVVYKIEELLSQLDNGVETLQKTKQQLAVYRQAVISDAFPSITEGNL